MFIFNRYSDNVAPNATVSAESGTEDAAYPLANVKDRNPAKPGRFTTTTGAVLFDFGAAQRLDLIALLHHNLTAGLEVRIQGNTGISWGSPLLNGLITIPAAQPDGYPVCPWLDLTTLAGYSEAGYQYWRLAVLGTNAAAVALGEVWLGAIKRTLVGVQYGIEFGDEHPLIEHRTDYKVSHIYDFGVRVRTVRASVRATEANRQAVTAWQRDCRGRARAGLVVPEHAVNDALMVRWVDQDHSYSRDLPDLSTFNLALEEVGRGLTL